MAKYVVQVSFEAENDRLAGELVDDLEDILGEDAWNVRRFTLVRADMEFFDADHD